MSIRFFDMFAGIGGFRSGLEAAGGFEYVGHCEIDKYANQAYNAIYEPKGELYFEDARTINPNACPISTSSVRDFHARASRLLENGSVLQMIQEELSSLRLPESLKRNGLHIFSWKMSPVCYRMTGAGHLKPSSPRLLNWGMVLNGVCITAQISESRSSEGGCILSQVLEDEVPERYFLSPAAMRKILKNLSPDRRDSESMIPTEQPALNAQAPEDGAAKRDCILLI